MFFFLSLFQVVVSPSPSDQDVPSALRAQCSLCFQFMMFPLLSGCGVPFVFTSFRPLCSLCFQIVMFPLLSDCDVPFAFRSQCSLCFQIVVFVIYALELKEMGTPVTATSGVAMYSPLVYVPSRRYEAWRFLTYMLMHQG